MSFGSKRILISFAIGAIASSSLEASEACGSGFLQQYNDSLRIVDSLRPDKNGQTRVYASDGSEFTAGQARWMQGQLRLVKEACVHGDQEAATRLLNDVQQLLGAHRKSS